MVSGWLDIPVNTCARESSSNTASRETVLLELPDVPRFNTGGTKEDTTAHFQGVVQCPCLRRAFFAIGVEPVHRVHDLRWLVNGSTLRCQICEGLLTTAMVKLRGVIRLITSFISSVWIRRPSKAPGDESLRWALGDR